MFDFAWSELGLIGAVALILIGPKDLPVAIRTITDMIKKARRMAGEFQGHVDEMLREANLGEVREQISSIRNFDIRSEIERHVDPDHSLRDTFAGNPLMPDATGETATAPAATGDAAVAELDPLADPVPAIAGEPQPAEVPAFIPPALVTAHAAADAAADAPAFIPPQAVLQRGTHQAA